MTWALHLRVFFNGFVKSNSTGTQKYACLVVSEIKINHKSFGTKNLALGQFVTVVVIA